MSLTARVCTATFLVALLFATPAMTQFSPAVQWYGGNTDCFSGSQGEFSLFSCVDMGYGAQSLGGPGSSCSSDGSTVTYNFYNASGTCDGPFTPMKSPIEQCVLSQPYNYMPYCKGSYPPSGSSSSSEGFESQE